jgi:hypothetical protein
MMTVDFVLSYALVFNLAQQWHTKTVLSDPVSAG